MNFRWFLQILALAVLLATVSANFDVSEIYQGCGEKSKNCFGDVDGCIQAKNCTFVVSASENATHYSAIIQNSCNIIEKNVFFGVGVHALIKNDVQPYPPYICTPKFEDFKYIILWNGDKCEAHQKIQQKWGYMVKGVVPPCSSTPQLDNLLDFAKTNMLIKSGSIPIERIENKGYLMKSGGIFITNMATSTQAHIVAFLAVIFGTSIFFRTA